MATIQRKAELQAISGERHTRQSSGWKRMKENVAAWIYRSWIARACCVGDVDAYEERVLDRAHKREVMRELLVSMSYGDSECIIGAVVEDLAEDGYDMRKKPPMASAVPDSGGGDGGPPSGNAKTTTLMSKQHISECNGICYMVGEIEVHVAPCDRGYDDGPCAGCADDVKLWLAGKNHRDVCSDCTKRVSGFVDVNHKPAQVEDSPCATPVDTRRTLTGLRVVPRFTAAVVVALRSRLGQMSAATPGVSIIVEREANRLMREYNVREVDAAAHLPRIVQCYFVADVHYHVPTSHARMTRLQRWLIGREPRPTLTAPLF